MLIVFFNQSRRATARPPSGSWSIRIRVRDVEKNDLTVEEKPPNVQQLNLGTNVFQFF